MVRKSFTVGRIALQLSLYISYSLTYTFLFFTATGLYLPNYHTSRCYSAAAEEIQSDASKTSPVKDSGKETVKGPTEKREFQAETRMLLDIVARSLYSDKEVSIIVIKQL